MKTQSQKYPQVFLYGESIFNLIPNDITPIIQRFWGSALTMDQLSAEEKQSKNHRVDDAYQLHPRNFSDRYQEWCFGKMVSPFKYTYFEYLLNVKFWGCKKKIILWAMVKDIFGRDRYHCVISGCNCWDTQCCKVFSAALKLKRSKIWYKTSLKVTQQLKDSAWKTSLFDCEMVLILE